MEAAGAFLARDSKRRELAAFETSPGSPVDPPAGQHVEQGYLLGEPQRIVEGGKRYRCPDPQSLRACGRHGAHHVDRRAHGETGKMMLREPHRVVARGVHDGDALERHVVDLAQRYRSVPPAEEL